MTILPVSPADAAELLAIYAPYVRDTAISFEYEVPSLSAFRQRIETTSARFPYLKAVDAQGHILGYAYASSFKSRKAYDWSVELSIYIRQDKRRAGLGRALYEALEGSLRRMGILAEETQPADFHVERVKKAYPAYFDTYAHMDELRAWLDTIENLYCIGRNGQHRYNNMDHSMATAFEAVRCIREGSADRTPIWSVNTEKSYHEEKDA